MAHTPLPQALNAILGRAAERLRHHTGTRLVELWAATPAAHGFDCLVRAAPAEALRRADGFTRRRGLFAFAPEGIASLALRPDREAARGPLLTGHPCALPAATLYAGSARLPFRALWRLVGARHTAVVPVGADRPGAFWVLGAAEPIPPERLPELAAAAAQFSLVLVAAEEAERARAAELRTTARAEEERDFAGRVSRVLASHRDIQGAFHAVATEISAVFPVDRAALMLYDGQRDRLERVAADPEGDAGLTIGDLRTPDGALAQALLTRAPRILPVGATVAPGSDGRDPILGPLAALGCRDVLWYPLSFRDHTVGLLALATRSAGGFSVRHVDLLHTIALPLAVALEDLRLRRAIQASERKYRDLYDNAPDMLLSIGPDRKILDCNATMARILGYDRAELIGRPVTDLHDPDFNRTFRRAFDSFVQEGFLDGLEGLYRRKDGSSVEVSMSATAIYDDRGAYVGSRSVVRDITERKALERRVLEAAKLAAVGQLAAGVAHELNNPLAGVVGFAHLLLEKVEDEYVRDRIQKILESGDRCRRIVEDLLLYARQRGPRIERVDLDRLLSRVVRLGEYQWRVANVTIFRPPADGIPMVEADPEQMEQVFLGLMSNAVDAMENGGELTIAMERSRLRTPPCPAVDIKFADTGPGIPPEVVPHIFEPFFTTKEVGKGTGLGLSIAYSIVKDHVGEILVETGRGRGTVFTVRLPVARPVAEVADRPS